MTCTNLLHATRATVTQSVQPGVSPRLLSELPRFFDGAFATMLAELFQNAHRANATTVSLVIDTTQRMFSVHDNGCGIGDPALVVNAGATGWDETQVVQPAGAGMFSLLTQEVEKVIIVSWRDDATPWRMTLTADHLRGLPVPIEQLADARPASASGTIVAVVFNHAKSMADTSWKDWHDDLLHSIRQARSLYPFKLTAQINDREHTVAPYRAWQPQVTIAVDGVGTLEWLPRDSSTENEVVWACKAIKARAFERALEKAAQANPEFALFTNGSFRWLIDPACGVRPKLPDRADLVGDIHLTQAVSTLTSVFANQMLEEARSATAHLKSPLKLGSRWLVEVPESIVGLPKWLQHVDVLEAVLKYLGWVESVYHQYAQYSIYYVQDDGIHIDQSEDTTWHRSLPSSPSCTVAFTLTQMGTPTHWVKADDPNELKKAVTLKGIRRHINAPHIVLCSQIRVAGVGTVPFLLSEEGFDEKTDGLDVSLSQVQFKGTRNAHTVTTEPCIVFAGNAAQFSEWFVQNADWLGPFIVCAEEGSYHGNTYDWLDGDNIDYALVERDLLNEVGVFDSQLAAKRRTYYRACDSLEALGEITGKLRNLQHYAHESPALRSDITPVLKLLAHCEKVTAALQKKQASLKRAAGIVTEDAKPNTQDQ